MEKLGFALSSHPDIFAPDEGGAKKRGAAGRTKRTEGVPAEGKGWKLLMARERLYDIYKDAAENRENKKSQRDLHDLKFTSDIMIQLGGLDYTTKQKEASLRSWAKYKVSLAKMLNNYNHLYSKFYRDLQMNVNRMNKSSNLEYSSPNQLIGNMRTTMMSMKSFIGMLQPMAKVMQRMNEINLNIIKLGHEVGPEGANKVFSDLSEKIQAYPDLSTGYTNIGRTDARPTDELMVGKFYQDWTRDCLSEGVDMLRYSTQNMERQGQKLKNLAALNKSANAFKAGRKESLGKRDAATGKQVGFQGRDYRSFSLPTSFGGGNIGGKQMSSVSYHKTAGSSGGAAFSTSSHLTSSGGPGAIRGESAVAGSGAPTGGLGGGAALLAGAAALAGGTGAGTLAGAGGGAGAAGGAGAHAGGGADAATITGGAGAAGLTGDAAGKHGAGDAGGTHASGAAGRETGGRRTAEGRSGAGAIWAAKREAAARQEAASRREADSRRETADRHEAGDRHEDDVREKGEEAGREDLHEKKGAEFMGSEMQIDTKILQELGDDLDGMPGWRGLEMDVQDIMKNEVLSDPYLLQSDSITQMALGKDIEGLDGSFGMAAQIQGDIFR